MLTGHAQITRLQTTVFPMGEVTVKLSSKVCTTSLDNLTNTIDMKEWVVLESNKIEASNLSTGAVLISTSNHLSGSLVTSV